MHEPLICGDIAEGGLGGIHALPAHLGFGVLAYTAYTTF